MQSAASRTVRFFSPLAPDGEIQDFIAWLHPGQTSRQTLALVGHEPDLSHWAQQLV